MNGPSTRPDRGDEQAERAVAEVGQPELEVEPEPPERGARLPRQPEHAPQQREVDGHVHRGGGRERPDDAGERNSAPGRPRARRTAGRSGPRGRRSRVNMAALNSRCAATGRGGRRAGCSSRRGRRRPGRRARRRPATRCCSRTRRGRASSAGWRRTRRRRASRPSAPTWTQSSPPNGPMATTATAAAMTTPMYSHAMRESLPTLPPRSQPELTRTAPIAVATPRRPRKPSSGQSSLAEC